MSYRPETVPGISPRRLGWPVGVEPTRDMSHSHARLSDSRHGHSYCVSGNCAEFQQKCQVVARCWSRRLERIISDVLRFLKRDWGTRGYSKSHSADYRSAALPLELQVQSLWSLQQDFNPHPSPYRGDTLALSYAGPTSVVQILPPLLFADSCLAHESA